MIYSNNIEQYPLYQMLVQSLASEDDIRDLKRFLAPIKVNALKTTSANSVIVETSNCSSLQLPVEVIDKVYSFLDIQEWRVGLKTCPQIRAICIRLLVKNYFHQEWQKLENQMHKLKQIFDKAIYVIPNRSKTVSQKDKEFIWSVSSYEPEYRIELSQASLQKTLVGIDTIAIYNLSMCQCLKNKSEESQKKELDKFNKTAQELKLKCQIILKDLEKPLYVFEMTESSQLKLIGRIFLFWLSKLKKMRIKARHHKQTSPLAKPQNQVCLLHTPDSGH